MKAPDSVNRFSKPRTISSNFFSASLSFTGGATMVVLAPCGLRDPVGDGHCSQYNQAQHKVSVTSMYLLSYRSLSKSMRSQIDSGPASALGANSIQRVTGQEDLVHPLNRQVDFVQVRSVGHLGRFHNSLPAAR